MLKEEQSPTFILLAFLVAMVLAVIIIAIIVYFICKYCGPQTESEAETGKTNIQLSNIRGDNSPAQDDPEELYDIPKNTQGQGGPTGSLQLESDIKE